MTFGTSLIDVFATRKASVMDPTADNSLGNVIAANSISVFLGEDSSIIKQFNMIYSLFARSWIALACGLHPLGCQES